MMNIYDDITKPFVWTIRHFLTEIQVKILRLMFDYRKNLSDPFFFINYQISPKFRS